MQAMRLAGNRSPALNQTSNISLSLRRNCSLKPYSWCFYGPLGIHMQMLKFATVHVLGLLSERLQSWGGGASIVACLWHTCLSLADLDSL